MKIPKVLEPYLTALKGKPMSSKEKWTLFLLGGILFAVIIFPSSDKKQSDLSKQTVQTQQTEAVMSDAVLSDVEQYEIYLSKRLKQILEQIDGAGTVDVWVTLEGSVEKVLYVQEESEYEQLQEKDSVGGVREEKSEHIKQNVLEESDGSPYVVKTIQPKVEGVLVVAQGAGDAVIKKHITEAVEALFDVDAHRIKIAKKKMEE